MNSINDQRVRECLDTFYSFNEDEQTIFIQEALQRMNPAQHALIFAQLRAILQRDFIGLLPKRGLDHIAEKILGYLDAESLSASGMVRRFHFDSLKISNL